jgi:type VI secretion system protein ImpC
MYGMITQSALGAYLMKLELEIIGTGGEVLTFFLAFGILLSPLWVITGILGKLAPSLVWITEDVPGLSHASRSKPGLMDWMDRPAAGIPWKAVLGVAAIPILVGAALFPIIFYSEQRDLQEKVYSIDLTSNAVGLPKGAKFVELTGQLAHLYTLFYKNTTNYVTVSHDLYAPVTSRDWTPRDPVRFFVHLKRYENAGNVEWPDAFQQKGSAVFYGRVSASLPAFVESKLRSKGLKLGPSYSLIEWEDRDRRVSPSDDAKLWSGYCMLLAIPLLLMMVLAKLLAEQSARTWSDKAEALVKLERWEDVLAAANRALRMDPACAARRSKVAALARLKRWDETLSAARDALRVDAKDLLMVQHKIVASEQLNQWELALASADEALSFSPKNMWACREKVRALGKLQRWEQQVTAADQALAIDPQSGDIWHLKTEALEKLGRWTEALFASERALELHEGPDNWHYKFHKAQALDRLGRLEEAVAIYQQVAAANPDATSQANLASALGRLRQTKASTNPAPPRKSLAHKIPRRVRISYERENASGDEIEEVEIPFVVGVIADFAGHLPANNRFAERSFFDVQLSDFNACFKAVQPRLSISVTDAISDPPRASTLQVDLKFESLADFTPEGVIAQVPPLAKMALVRNQLQSLISCSVGVDETGRRLNDFAAIGAKLTPGSAEYNAWSEVRSFAESLRAETDLEPPLVAFRTSIDRRLSDQLKAILHAPDFRRLEAIWRGLKYLASIVRTMSQIRIRAISMSKKELEEDLARVAEFDQSHVFKKVIQPLAEVRGEPFSLLVADYEFGASDEDLSVLRPLSQVAVAVQAPLLAAAAPDLAGVNDLKELSANCDLTSLIESPRLARWRSFTNENSSRYVALTLPRVLMRIFYDALDANEGFAFEEKEGCLWGNGAYAVAARILIAFAANGWCAEICGHPHGLVRDVPVQYQDGNNGRESRGPVEIVLSRERTLELSRLGFIVIEQSDPDDEKARIHSAPTCQKPNIYDWEQASAWARLASDLRYILAISRFMHFLAMRLRDRTGGFVATSELESSLNKSLSEYIAGSETAVSPRRPLLSGAVQLVDRPGQPGTRALVFSCIPAYQLQALPINLRAAMQIPHTEK